MNSKTMLPAPKGKEDTDVFVFFPPGHKAKPRTGPGKGEHVLPLHQECLPVA